MASNPMPVLAFQNKPSTVFIVGAGAHCDIGMPTGEGLRELILANNFVPRFRRGTMGYGDPMHEEVLRADTKEFLRIFRESTQYSIDKFLESDAGSTYRGLGATHIAYALLQKQAEAFLTDAFNKSWYRWLYLHLLDSVRDLASVQCSLITFNYDTVFESMIAMMHSRTHGVSLSNSISAAMKMPIYHVYGSLNQFPTEDSRTRRCIMASPSECAATAAAGLKLMGDRDLRPEHLQRVRSIVRAAEVVVFLGFAFDTRNLARIGFDEHDTFWAQRPSPQCFGTCMGIPAGRFRRIEQDLSIRVRWADANWGCRELLENLFEH